MRWIRSLGTLILVGQATLWGCSSTSVTADAGADGSPLVDTGPSTGDGRRDVTPAPDAATPCEEPVAGMQVAADTTLCAGEYSLADPTSKGAIRIVGDNLTLRCLGTVIQGSQSYGKADPKEWGIMLQGREEVTIRGCTIRGYRYGLYALGSKKLQLLENDLSDNFTDEKAEWVFDTVQGGGIRLEKVSESTIEENKLQRNWNGLDLRECDKLVVKKNIVDHCANTAALIVATHNSVFEENDMSWGVRGGLVYPSKWWGVDTKDSAGMLLEAGSSYNRIVKNDLTYGGDGLFLRSVLGPCPHHNHVEGNDTSFSPHNAIESWCDDNTYIGNKANKSDYGFWLGGSDRTVVRGNVISDNRTDGMSIQIGESRTTIIEENTIENNGRVGILATGREYQSWHSLSNWSPNLANASHYLIQRNTFGKNTKGDIFLSSIRGVLLASNVYGGADTVTVGQEALDVRTIGSGLPPGTDLPPEAKLTVGSAQLNQTLILSAGGSSDPEGKPLTYSWLVQDALVRFEPAAMLTPLLAKVGGVQEMLIPDRPGVFDVFLLVDDGTQGAQAASRIHVAPVGLDLAENNASSWSADCLGVTSCQKQIADEASQKVAGLFSIRVSTDAPYLFRLKHAAPAGAPYDLSLATKVGFFVRAENPNQGWQSECPWLVLRSKFGTASYKPSTKWLASAQNEWIYLEVPLAGGPGWSKSEVAMDWGAVTAVELEMDTLGYSGYQVWIDGLTWY